MISYMVQSPSFLCFYKFQYLRLSIKNRSSLQELNGYFGNVAKGFIFACDITILLVKIRGSHDMCSTVGLPLANAVTLPAQHTYVSL